MVAQDWTKWPQYATACDEYSLFHNAKLHIEPSVAKYTLKILSELALVVLQHEQI